ncbi:putative C4-dicarboxylate response regulator DctR [Brevibacillus agri]|uniref:Transcriptional regulatory protein n=2 Tax=Brevibacillus TaxID=55080 RepID=A0A3M8AW59_9BACL|nr:response regulator [Brevibacillus agri]ELK41329.1 two-component response regulator [Brevibacillus agri BAB-2500]QHZ57964.1 response regulator [Brevibacillus sp. NSP2.1]MED1642919.1 response regulator [Brevibacillus agri]MED1652647.1 response regulator [Brevibacillus agri]MED1688341.1 response regulator [Brevibacillus agri]
METDSIRVLVVEDDPMVQEINKQFIERVPGFTVVGMAANGADGVWMVQELGPDLVIMDIFMPIQDGVKALAELRAAGQDVDVIVVTAAKDKATIQAMLRGGAMDYIIKPFAFDRMKKSLETYREFRQKIEQAGAASQDEVDQLLFRGASEREEEQARSASAGTGSKLSPLPKGLHAVTLEQIIRQLDNEDQALSAEDVAERVGIARVTARRYLDYLEKAGMVRIDVSYGGVGRPTNRYVRVDEHETGGGRRA